MILLAAVIGLLLISAMLAASETALFALARMRHTRARLGEKTLAIVESMLRRPLESLVVIIGLSETANVFAECLGTSLMLMWFGRAGTWLAVPAMLTLVLLIGDITPKTVALGFPGAVLWLTARPLAGLGRAARPLIGLFAREEENHSTAPLSESEFMAMLHASERGGHVDAAEREMIRKVFAFGARRVAEIMTPRDKIFALDIAMPLDQAIVEVTHSHYSRVPIYRGSPDNVVGILRAKDLVARRLEPAQPRIERLLRKPVFVPPGKTLTDLFDEMRRERYQLAFVVDEYGHLLGLVTLEDLLEELFGEIRDEFEFEGPELKQVGENEWVASGTISISRLVEALRPAGDLQPSGPARSLSSLVLRRLGRIPQPGERVRLGDFEAGIEKVRGATVEQVRLERCI